MMVRHFFWLLAVVFLLGIACGSDPVTPAQLAQGCQVNTDCQAPFVCAFRRCHQACAATRDCKAGRCMDGDWPFHVCQLDEEKGCSYNSNCPGGQTCGSDRQCRDQCRVDRDCLAAQVCIEGTCAEQLELKSGGLPSAPIDGGVDASREQRCAYTSECDLPLVCRRKVCSVECRTAIDCPQGSDCVNGRCLGASGVRIGAEGGTVTDASGRVTLTVPPRALQSPVSIAILPLETWPQGALGPAFEILPSGLGFDIAGTLTVRYAAADLGAVAPRSVNVGLAIGSRWIALPSAVDPEAGTVTAGLAHLSVYGLVGPLPDDRDGGVPGTIADRPELPGADSSVPSDAGSRDAGRPTDASVPTDAAARDGSGDASGSAVCAPWRSTSPPAITGSAMAFDTLRGKAVVFGGKTWSQTNYADTWEWNGTSWTEATPASAPPARSAHAMAFDGGRGKTVLFGGVGDRNVMRADTWEWDGATWFARTPAASPSARMQHAMAYDSARGKVVLFGGGVVNTSYADTWEWDGANWTKRTPATSPPARFNHVMAYDSARRVTVLFGGTDSNTSFTDTWEWDGTNWTQRTTTTSPPGVPNYLSIIAYQYGMSYDAARGKSVLVVANPFGLGVTTWEWDGTTWTAVSTEGGPAFRLGQVVAYDSARRKTVIFGGEYDYQIYADTWEWDGATWTQRALAPNPFPCSGASTAYDTARGKVVLFGGYSTANDFQLKTWEGDGTTWTGMTSSGPAGRIRQAMTYDAAHAKVVLFGGYGAQGYLADTWEWDGTTWTQRQSATVPPARGGHGMTYDEVRQKVVVFGGYSPGSLSDIWEWDGTDWSERHALSGPSGAATMVYDRALARVVVFAAATGADGGTLPSHLWEWDGTSWSSRAPAFGPPSRTGYDMVYDSARQRIILHGGQTPMLARLTDTWEWDGAMWAQLPTVAPPVDRDAPIVYYDVAHNKVVLFGGYHVSGLYPQDIGDTWEYDPQRCAVDAGAP